MSCRMDVMSFSQGVVQVDSISSSSIRSQGISNCDDYNPSKQNDTDSCGSE